MSIERIPRHLRRASQSFFLFGPRGTGKTTWLQDEFPGAQFINLLEPETTFALQARPERLKEWVLGRQGTSGVVVLDEIQRVPEALSVVHQLLFEHPKLTFVLTGSSARKLKRTGVDLLAGRALLRTCHPFTAAELGARFNLEEALTCGTLPVVLGSTNPQETLRSYAAVYVREEVQMEGLVRQAGVFARVLESASFSQGSQVNAAEIARECHVDARTVAVYMSILEDMLLAFTVPVFSKRAQRVLAQRAKFYYFDCGVFQTLRPRGPLDRPEEIAGAALETLVAQHLRAWCEYSAAGDSLFHWRTKAAQEVDFVVYGEKSFAAIEVKHAGKLTSRDLNDLRTFREDYPEAVLFCLYRGNEAALMDGILCLPCAEFLTRLAPGALLTHAAFTGTDGAGANQLL